MYDTINLCETPLCIVFDYINCIKISWEKHCPFLVELLLQSHYEAQTLSTTYLGMPSRHQEPPESRGIALSSHSNRGSN